MSKVKREEDGQWKKGSSPNPAGRPRGTGRSVSRLRRVISQLEEMTPDALDNIARSVRREEVEKSVLDTSKWVVTTIPSLSRAATQEESLRESVRARQEDKELREAEIEAIEKSNAPSNRFSSNIIPFKVEDDEDDE